MAPRAHDVAAYAAAPIGRQISIRPTSASPSTRADGSLFGTLCAIAPEEQPEAIVSEQPKVELLARLLSTMLERDLVAADTERRASSSRPWPWWTL